MLAKVNDRVKGMSTLLNELEPIGKVALIPHEQQTTIVRCLVGGSFLRRHLWPKLDTTTNDTAILRGNIEVLKVGSRIGLTSVCCKWTPGLGLLVFRERIPEVVVFIRILSKGRVVSCWCNVDRCSCIESEDRTFCSN